MGTRATIKRNEKRKNPAKKANSIPIAFRVTPFVLGRALDGLWSYNGNFEPEKLNQLVKDVFYIGLNNITEHLRNGIISDEAKATLVSLSDQIHLDALNDLTTRTINVDSVRNTNPNNCDKNLFEQQVSAIIDDRKYNSKYYTTSENQKHNDDTTDDKQKQFKEQIEKENEEFMKRLKAGEIE